MIFSASLTRWYHSTPIWRLLYQVAYFLLLLELIRLVRSPTNIEVNLSLYSAAALSSIGLTIWARPIVLHAAKSKLSENMLKVLQAFVLVVSVIPARDAVSYSLELPPQDFDLTVAILTLVFCPIIWLGASTVLVLIAYLTSIGSMFILSVVSSVLTPIEALASIVKPQGLSIAEKYQEKKRAISVYSNDIIGHSMGIFAILVLLTHLFTWASSFPTRIEDFVRLVAYFADYHEQDSYPGLIKSTKSRLHENGIVSYAIPTGNLKLNIFVSEVDFTSQPIVNKFTPPPIHKVPERNLTSAIRNTGG